MKPPFEPNLKLSSTEYRAENAASEGLVPHSLYLAMAEASGCGGAL
jgi:hypothetical protein